MLFSVCNFSSCNFLLNILLISCLFLFSWAFLFESIGLVPEACPSCPLCFFALQDSRKLEQLYCDPEQRLVADCILMDVDTAVVSDRKGSIAVLSCSNHLEGKFVI